MRTLRQQHGSGPRPEHNADLIDPAGGMPAMLSPIPGGVRSCCCPARPAVQVVLPAAAGRPGRELLLCGHHHRAGRAQLESLDAAVYDATGWPVALPGWPSPG